MKKPAAPITYRWITLAEAEALGVSDLVQLHWAEVVRDGVPLAPDWPQYRRLERLGIYRAVAAIKGGRLIGYNSFFVQPTIHHATTIFAINDLLYLEPEHRRGLAGALLIRRAEDLLKTLGVRKVLYASKPYLDLARGSTNAKLAELFKRLGYTDAETIHEKLL